MEATCIHQQMMNKEAGMGVCVCVCVCVYTPTHIYNDL